jgi:putative membrane protein
VHLKRIAILVFVLALLAAGVIYSEISLRDVAEALRKAGWGIVLVLLARMLVTLMLAIAWIWLIPKDMQPSVRDCVTVRIVRDAINSLLPVAQVGGDFVGARLLGLRRVAPAVAAASVVTDVFLQVATQFLFTLLALGLLMYLGGGGGIVANVAGGLSIAAPALVAFLFVQRRGFGDITLKVLKKLAGERALGVTSATDAFYSALVTVQARKGAITASSVMHFLAWGLGSLEVWLALHFIGHPVSIAEAVVIEGLGQAVRGVAFAVPGAIGVQEGGFVILSGVFGVPPEPALAMALIKRAADLAIGLPGLFLWHQMEARMSVPSSKAQIDAALLPEEKGR